jgi:glyoxylase-like metal-dependent hydrolase (beta-lactamase superfamily II)
MVRIVFLAALLLVGACGTLQQKPAAVERMYVISCGENQTSDLSRWTPGENVGKPHVFGDHCYLIKHARGWMLWDSGNADRLAALPNGLTNPQGTITAFMPKPLADSLKEIGVAPGDIGHFAMSHSHGDHSGNANLFGASTIYMQQAEYDAVFGPDAQKYNLPAANFEKLKGSKFVRLDGDHDVFGDGSVVIKPAPGHTPGHQVLAVRLPRRGLVLLSGDMVHLVYSWEHNIVPGFNYDVERSRRSIAEMKEYVARTGAKIWVNHDKEQHAAIPKAPAYVE